MRGCDYALVKNAPKGAFFCLIIYSVIIYNLDVSVCCRNGVWKPGLRVVVACRLLVAGNYDRNKLLNLLGQEGSRNI